MPFAICGIPELPAILRPPVSHVISFLDPAWPEPEALGAWPAEKRHLYRYDDVVTPREGVIAPDEALIEKLYACFEQIAGEQPQRLLIHCHAGRSRSTATALLWLHHSQGLEARALSDRLLASRPGAWPNTLILRLADRQLGTGGLLEEAGRLTHRRTAVEDPEFTEWLTTTRRAHEVEVARAALR